jgi:hypothetical protein
MNNKHYSTQKKKKLADKINSIETLEISKEKKIEYYKQIKKIITKNNSVDFVKKSNCFLANFEDFSTNTYVQLNKFFNAVDKEIQNYQDLDNKKFNSQIDMTQSSDNFKKYKAVSKKLRLTNTETHLLNRAKYEKELIKNENNYDSDTDDNRNIYNTDNNTDINNNSYTYSLTLSNVNSHSEEKPSKQNIKQKNSIFTKLQN